MARIIEYDNDEKGYFYVVEYQNGKENVRVVLRNIHDFSGLIGHLERNCRSFDWTLKPVPGLAERLLEEHEKGKNLDYTDRMIAMDLGIVDGGKWKNKVFNK